jgi:hypothetical protein
MSTKQKPAHEAVALMYGCYTSLISVVPKDRKTSKASLKKDWCISYRFHDPQFKDDPGINTVFLNPLHNSTQPSYFIQGLLWQ